MTVGRHQSMRKGATVVGTFRYRLYRSWGPGGDRSVCFVMLNPSTADADTDDPTVRKCIGFATRWGFCSVDVVNLYAYRATSPKDLRAAAFPVGPENNRHISDALSFDPARGGYADLVVVAWGTNAQRHRADSVLRLIRNRGHEPLALATTKRGAPQHPLYVPYETEPKPYTGDVHPKCYAWARTAAR